MIILSEVMKRDVQSPSTTLNYIIVINPEENPIYIANQKQFFEEEIWEDLNLKINNIRENLDLVDRNFTINNVSLNLTNKKINNVRFSDMISEFSLINKVIDIYYKTNSCKNLQDCALVYRGKIKHVKHDDNMCQIRLEDNTEDKLSKKVPTANVGYRKAAYSKEYFSRPIPIVYGEVNKAPAIPLFDESIDENDSYSQDKIHIICDDTKSDRNINLGGFFYDEQTYHLENTINPLYIYKEDYFQVLEEWSYRCTDETNLWQETDQYAISGNELLINKKFEIAEAVNPPANNELCCIKKRRPNDLQLLQNPSAADASELTVWGDSVGFGVRFTQETILSPSSCFDSPDSVSKSSYFYSGNFSGVLNSYTQIPNQSISLQEDWNYVCVDFRPCSDLGIANVNEATAIGHSNSSNAGQSFRDYKNKWQYEITSWFNRYAHFFNDEGDDETNILFIKLPSIEAIGKAVNRMLWSQFSNPDTVSEEETHLGQIYQYHRDAGLPYPEIVGMTALTSGWYSGYGGEGAHAAGGLYIPNYSVWNTGGLAQDNPALAAQYGNASVRINAETNISGANLDAWKDYALPYYHTHFDKYYSGDLMYSHLSNDPYGWDYPINFGYGYQYIYDGYAVNGDGTNYSHYTFLANAPAISPLYQQGYEVQIPAFSTYFNSLNATRGFRYPKLRIQIKSLANTSSSAYDSPVVDTFKTAPISDSEEVEYNILDVLPNKYVTVGLKSSNTCSNRYLGGSGYSAYNTQANSAYYYELFDIGTWNYLFNPDDFTQYKPISLTHKTKPNNGNMVFPYYTAYWNGISPQECPDVNDTQNFGADINYFGGYNRGFDENGRVSERMILGGTVSATHNDGWAIWVRKDIDSNSNLLNVGEAVEGFTLDNEYNEPELSNCTIKKHTLLPIVGVSY